MITQFSQIPKWMLPGGQMFSDPRVEYHWEAIRKEVEMCRYLNVPVPEAAIVDALMGIMDGVPYTSETDQERAANPNYAPIECAGEFWVLYEAQKYADSYISDRDRADWPEWGDYQEFDEVFLSGLDDEPEDDDEDDLSEFIPGTSPWQEYIDNQRSRMVNDMVRATESGKKWGKHPAFMLVALQALDDGKSYAKARELAFMAYHMSFAVNIKKVRANGLVVECADFSTGKRTTAYKLLPWKYVYLVKAHLHPAAQKRINEIVDEIAILIAEEQERHERLIAEFIARSKKRLASCRTK
jgi:hypothetical protein